MHGLENFIKSTNPKLGVVRYADDFIVTSRDKGSLETAQIQIKQWLSDYYKGVVSKETFSYISHRVWKYLWRWANRNHPNKNTKWVWKRYFKTIKGNKWTFATTASDRRGNKKQLILYPIAYTPIERHVKVKGEASPDDPSIKEYWEKRHQKYGKSYWDRNSRNYKIAQNQN